MRLNIHCRLLPLSMLGVVAAGIAQNSLAANRYTQHNLVSDIPGMADKTDSNLVNPWGISMSATSPFWISNNHSGTSTLYDGAGQGVPAGKPIVVTIPAPSGAKTSRRTHGPVI